MLWCYGIYDKEALAHTHIQALIIPFDVSLRASCYGVYDRRAKYAHNLLFNIYGAMVLWGIWQKLGIRISIFV